jgi:hypothetical protein
MDPRVHRDLLVPYCYCYSPWFVCLTFSHYYAPAMQHFGTKKTTKKLPVTRM